MGKNGGGLMFPRLYSDESCPIDGYAGYTFRVLLNPTRSEIGDWQLGGLGVDGCEDCAKLNTQRGKQGGSVETQNIASLRCARCAALRDHMGRGAVAVYGTSRVEGFDFTTPESALATFDMDSLPDELRLWLYMLPDALWLARQMEIKKKLPQSSLTGNSTPDSA